MLSTETRVTRRFEGHPRNLYDGKCPYLFDPTDPKFLIDPAGEMWAMYPVQRVKDGVVGVILWDGRELVRFFQSCHTQGFSDQLQ